MRISLLGIFFAVFSLPVLAQSVTKPITISLNAAADVVVTNPDGKRFGYDSVHKKNLNEIKGAELNNLPGREPVYRIPVGNSIKPLTITITGQDEGTVANLSITGVRFSINVKDMPVNAGAVVTVRVMSDGRSLEYSSNTTTAEPKFVFAVDPKDVKRSSYIFSVSGGSVAAKTVVKIEYKLNDIFIFGDNAKTITDYDVNVLQIKADGKEHNFKATRLQAKKINHFELDLTKWNGKTGECLRFDSKICRK